MGKTEIYETSLIYKTLKPVVDYSTRYSYRKAEVHGIENLPEDGAYILAPNHCNTLMDALVILRSHKKATVFGARADLFNNPFIAKIMTFVKILPMVRQRDGLRNVLKNHQTQETILATMEYGTRFCMYPEGKHRTEHSLQTLGKGIFRAVLAADKEFGDKKPVYIVPVGIEYGDYFRYRSTSLVNIGKPINVTEFVRNPEIENEAQIIDCLRKDLYARMSELITFHKDDDYLKEKWILTKMLAIDGAKKGYGDFGTSLYDSMCSNRKTASAVDAALELHPEEMKSILEEVKEFDRKRRKKGISVYSFREIKNPVWNAIGKGSAALIGLPYWIFSAVVSLPMWLSSFIIRRKVKDKAFRNTVSFGVKLSLGNILFITYAVLAFCLLPWYTALAFLLLTIPSYSYFHDYIEGMRRFISDLNLMGEKDLHRTFKEITESYKKI